MPDTKQTHVRYLIVTMLFIASTFSYGDRVVLSIAGVAISKDIHMDAVRMGYLFSGFSWAYVVGQLPSGGLLDRFGSKRIYGISIVAWSLCALFAGLAGYLPAAFPMHVAGNFLERFTGGSTIAFPLAFTVLFLLRLLSGLAQSPVFPGNGRIVAAWFPTAERGSASAIFNSSQYFALVLFAPFMGWITHRWGWKYCFWSLGILGILLSFVWSKVVYGVKNHPRISQPEIDHIELGGGLVNMDRGGVKGNTLTWSAVKLLLSNRMLVGVYLGQYCITTLTWFFLTWFPVYLSQARHMSIVKVGFVAALPALCGSIGGILGGVISDKLLRMGHSLSFARKLPIVFGMSLSMTMIACNYANAQWVVVALMSLAFFGKGIGALGWTVVSDTSPKGMIGLNGGLFNLIGNMAGITTPIIIGYIVKKTGSFNDALLFVGATALLAIIAYLPIVGEIKRAEFPSAVSPEVTA